MITAIRHVGIVVADLEKSLRFWRDTLGFVVARQMEESGSHIDAIMGLRDASVTTIKLSAPDGNLIELLYFPSHPDKQRWEGKPFSTGLTHIALTVSDLDQTLCRLKLAGGSVSSEPQLSLDGQVRVIYATGPEGVLLELVEIVEK